MKCPEMIGSDVAWVQWKLGRTPHGVFTPCDAAAVRTYQKAKKLTVSGTVTAKTWKALLAAL